MYALRPPMTVALSYNYKKLLESVWQRTSYMARATKSVDIQTDLREKALSPDDESLFNELIKASCEKMYAPLCKWGKRTRSAVTIEDAPIYKRHWCYDQGFTYNITHTNNKITVNISRSAEEVRDVAVKLLIKYEYRVACINSVLEHKVGYYKFEAMPTSDSQDYILDDLQFEIDTEDNGLGIESLYAIDAVEVIKEMYLADNPQKYMPGDWVEYEDKDKRISYFKVLTPCNENDFYPMSPFFDLQTGDYHDALAFEVNIPCFDANMLPIIDQSLFEALVTDVALRWAEIANPNVVQAATLASERAYEAYDMSVWNAVPHTHRNRLHYY